jgi:hypothetical protein
MLDVAKGPQRDRGRLKMPDAADLVTITLAIGARMNGDPITEDFRAFRNLVTDQLSALPNDGPRLNLVFDLVGPDSKPVVAHLRTRFDPRFRRVTVALSVPSSLRAERTTEFIKDSVRTGLEAAERQLEKNHLQGDLVSATELLRRATDAMPQSPLSAAERYREAIPDRPSPGHPVREVAELDGGGWEIRKVAVFADGSMDYAVRSIETGGVHLNSPTVSGGRVRAIPRSEFDEVWQAAVDQPQPRGPIVVRE